MQLESLKIFCDVVRWSSFSRGVVIECGDAWEVHHFALLLGYGAGTINPYLAFETLDDLIRREVLTGIDHEEAVYRYRKAIKKGVVKVMSKMGISTIQSYCGAQISEAIGLSAVDRPLPLPSRHSRRGRTQVRQCRKHQTGRRDPVGGLHPAGALPGAGG
jgi:hypothetical protein